MLASVPKVARLGGVWGGEGLDMTMSYSRDGVRWGNIPECLIPRPFMHGGGGGGQIRQRTAIAETRDASLADRTHMRCGSAQEVQVHYVRFKLMPKNRKRATSSDHPEARASKLTPCFNWTRPSRLKTRSPVGARKIGWPNYLRVSPASTIMTNVKGGHRVQVDRHLNFCS